MINIHKKKICSKAYHKYLNIIPENMSSISFQIVDYKSSTTIADNPTQKNTKESLLIENMDYETSSGQNPIQNGS